MLSYSVKQRLFTREVLTSIADGRENSMLSLVQSELGLQSISGLFDSVYLQLSKHYRNDYFYRCQVVNKLFISRRHNLQKSVVMSEFRVGNAKADVVILNGTSTAYEIKSDIDNLDRLSFQIQEYSKVFDRIYVVVNANIAKFILDSMQPHIGVIGLTDDNTLRPFRQACSNIDNVKLEVMFDSLRKEEYTQIIQQKYGTIPNVPNTKIFTECKTLFTKLDKQEAHNAFVRVLKTRLKYSNVLQENMRQFPSYLAPILLQSRLTDDQYISLMCQFCSKETKNVSTIFPR